jgi:short-chain fatty acids transporter
MLERIGAAAERWVRRYMPDPFLLVILLTIVSFALALPFLPGGAPAGASVGAHLAAWSAKVGALCGYWFKGFWELLSFAMQMVLIVVTGEAIAAAPRVNRALAWLAARPRTPWQALYWTTFAAMLLGWLHWGFGLVAAGLFAREVAAQARRRGTELHYPLLGAAAYTSMLLWHAGTTATAPLLINTKGHFLFAEIGIVPLSQTVLTPSNLVACGVLLATVPFVVAAMRPRAGALPIGDEALAETAPEAPAPAPAERTFATRVDESYATSAVIVLLGAAFLLPYLWRNGLSALNHNVVNFAFIMLGLLLHRSPVAYARAVARSLRGTAGIVLQFPFYGGIMGVMRDSGLGHAIASFFVGFATVHTLPFFTYLLSVLTKLFVPSGGGEWAVEGPVMIRAAKTLGASVGQTTMGIAYGNMVGNMFQPFWAIPLLGILGLRARDIMGYCLVLFLVAFPVLGLTLLLTR